MSGDDLRLWYEGEFVSLNASAIERNHCLHCYNTVHDCRLPQRELVGAFRTENKCNSGVVHRGLTPLVQRLKVRSWKTLETLKKNQPDLPRCGVPM